MGNKLGTPALFRAAAEGDTDDLSRAVFLGAEVDTHDDDNGLTALHHAAVNSCFLSIKCLDDNGLFLVVPWKR